jgi:hypothetical protein
MHALRLTCRYKEDAYQGDACLLSYDVNVLDGAVIGDDVRDHFNARPSTNRLYILAPFIPETVVIKAMQDGSIFQRLSTYFSALGGEVSLLTFRDLGDGLRPVALPFVMADDTVSMGSPIPIDKSLRDGWLFDLFDKNKGLVSAPRGVHFGKGSTKHSEQFLRTSGILLSSVCCATVAYFVHDVTPCIQPKRILVDTAPLISVVFALQRIANLHKVWNLHVPVDSFSSYGGIDKLPRASGRELVLISASTSGGLVGRLIDKGYLGQNLVTLFFLESAKPANVAFPLVCDLTFQPGGFCGYSPIRNYAPQACPLCSDGYFLAELEGDQFLLEKRSIKRLLIKTKSQPTDARASFEELARNELFGVPIFAASKYRVEVCFDAEKALRVDTIRTKFVKIIRRFLPVPLDYVILVDLDEHGFRDLMEVAGLSGILTNTEFLLPGALSHAATKTGAGVAVVFGCLSNYSQARDINARLRVVAPLGCISYLSLLTLAETREQFLDLHGFLTYGKSGSDAYCYADAYRIAVPFVHDPRSSWDLELELLQRIKDRAPLEEELDNRLEFLRTSNERSNFLFLPGRNEALSIKEDFVYLSTNYDREKISQADVYLIVANLLACSRGDDRSLLKSETRSPLQWSQSIYGQTLLGVENFSNYNDAVLRASFLRVATRAELQYSVDEKSSETMLSLITTGLDGWEQGIGDFIPELIVSLASRRLVLTDGDTIALKARLKAAKLPPYLRQLADEV